MCIYIFMRRVVLMAERLRIGLFLCVYLILHVLGHQWGGTFLRMCVGHLSFCSCSSSTGVFVFLFLISKRLFHMKDADLLYAIFVWRFSKLGGCSERHLKVLRSSPCGMFPWSPPPSCLHLGKPFPTRDGYNVCLRFLVVYDGLSSI